jgi:hypothetical protein
MMAFSLFISIRYRGAFVATFLRIYRHCRDVLAGETPNSGAFFFKDENNARSISLDAGEPGEPWA